MSNQPNLFAGQSEIKGAEFSDDRLYRYVLYRVWDKGLPRVAFIGLNPSTANEQIDDPTIRRVRGFAKNWGYGGFYMLNLFAFVTAHPEELLKCDDPVGDNDNWLKKIGSLSQDIIFAWGAFKESKDRAKSVIAMFPNARCFKKNKDGSPVHPLYQPLSIIPIKF